MTLKDKLVTTLGSLGIVWYYISLVVVGLNLIDGGGDASLFREFMSVSITTIGVSLATFVGMLLGVRAFDEEIRNDANNFVKAAQGTTAGAGIAPSKLTSRLQWFAAILYVLSLFLALGFWYYGGNRTDPAVIKLGQSVLGLFGGALSILLNIK